MPQPKLYSNGGVLTTLPPPSAHRSLSWEEYLQLRPRTKASIGDAEEALLKRITSRDSFRALTSEQRRCLLAISEFNGPFSYQELMDAAKMQFYEIVQCIKALTDAGYDIFQVNHNLYEHQL